MAIYLVGDIQGCYSELKALLAQVDFDKHKDQLWVAGDLVARGPDSYLTLKYLYSLGSSVKAVLGNHDLHLLAIYAGLKKAKKSDLLDELLSAPDAEELIDWLAQQPLLRQLPNEEAYLSHAGLSPQWDISTAKKMARFVAEKLKSNERNNWLSVMYGEKPCDWHEANSEQERFRYAVNAFTRMRFCNVKGHLDFECKDSPNNAPNSVIPWYDSKCAHLSKVEWVFGHWAALMGVVPHKNLYALDTGCVWGGHLTLLRWHDKAIFIEQAHKNLL